MRETEERVDKEVERRLHDNFLDWEEDYKRKKIESMREQVIKEVRSEYEFKMEELLEAERIKMEN